MASANVRGAAAVLKQMRAHGDMVFPATMRRVLKMTPAQRGVQLKRLANRTFGVGPGESRRTSDRVRIHETKVAKRAKGKGKGKGWHGDSAGHAAAASKGGKKRRR